MHFGVIFNSLPWDIHLRDNQQTTCNNCVGLFHRDLSDNRVSSLHETPFRGLSQLHDLLLSYNEIETIPRDAFDGAPRLQLL